MDLTAEALPPGGLKVSRLLSSEVDQEDLGALIRMRFLGRERTLNNGRSEAWEGIDANHHLRHAIRGRVGIGTRPRPKTDPDQWSKVHLVPLVHLRGPIPVGGRHA